MHVCIYILTYIYILSCLVYSQMVPLFITPYFLKDEARIWRSSSKTYSCLKNQHKYSLYFVCKLFLAWSQSKQWAQ